MVADLTLKLREEQSQRTDFILKVLAALSFSGLLLLIAPIFLIRRYPWRFFILVRYSILSSALSVVVALILVGLYALTRLAFSAVSTASNPQLAVTEAFFDFLINRADQLAIVGPTIIEPTVRALQADPTAPPISLILVNVDRFVGSAGTLELLAKAAHIANALYALVPFALLVGAFAMFFRNAKPTILGIIRLPGSAAAGEYQPGKTAVRSTARGVWHETQHAIVIIGVLLLLTVVMSSLGRGALEPAMSLLVNNILASGIYVQLAPGAEPALVYFGIVASLLVLVFSMVLSTAAGLAFIWRASSYVRSNEIGGLRSLGNRGLWVRGVLSLGWVMTLPILYAQIAGPGFARMAQSGVDRGDWTFVFVILPILYVALFAATFWSAKGTDSLASVWSFGRPSPPPAVVSLPR